MARLPLIINGQRLRTLEELRENFNLAELLERFHGGQLRAWLYNWDFKAEQEQVEALPADLSEPELTEALCRIFCIEGGSKEQALNSLKEEKARQVQEQQLEAQRQQEQQRQEEQRKAEESRPLALDEIEFDWQMTEGPDVKLLTAGPDRFVTVTNDSRAYYSYDGSHWEGGDDFIFLLADILYCCNSNFMCSSQNALYDHSGRFMKTCHISQDCKWVNALEIDEDINIKKIIWTGERYIALSSKETEYSYLQEGEEKTSTYPRPAIYAAERLTGPWFIERLDCLEEGDIFTDIAFFNNQFIIEGMKSSFYCINHQRRVDEQFRWIGPSISELKRIPKKKSSYEPTRLWQSKHLCFSDNEETTASMTKDGPLWTGKLKYRITGFVDADRFLVARLFEPDSWSDPTTWNNMKDIGFHVSLDGINWRKLDTPLQQGQMAYLNGKLLIADGSKVAIGTLRTAHRNETEKVSKLSTSNHKPHKVNDLDLCYNLKINTEEARSGITKEITITRSEVCSSCSGSGYMAAHPQKLCSVCDGFGLVQGCKSLQVHIPAGIESGSELQLRKEGNAGRNKTQPGDLYVRVIIVER